MKQLEPLLATSSPSVPSAGAVFFHQFVPIGFALPSPRDYLCHDSLPPPIFTTAGAAASDGLPQGNTHRLSSSLPVLVTAKMKPEAETESSTEAIGDNADDLFNAYMNLDYFDALNASATEEKPDDLDTGRLILLRRVTADSTTANDGIKERNKSGAATANHFRSISMDSLIGKLQGTMTNTSSSDWRTRSSQKWQKQIQRESRGAL